VTKRLILIRHGKTHGNLEKRYIGAQTDEPLCDEGRQELSDRKNHIIAYCGDNIMIFASPMKRCIESAKLLFGERQINIVDDFKEIDFSDFENKNYQELNGNPDYQAWIDSNGEDDYPGGERKDDFISRNIKGLKTVLDKLLNEAASTGIIVCHGGTIMSILSQMTNSNYFDFQITNCEGYEIVLDVTRDELTGQGESYACISYNRI